MFRVRYLAILFGLIVKGTCLAQGNLYINGGFEITGLTYNYRFQQQGHVLRRSFLLDHGDIDTGVGLTFNLALHKSISRYVGLEFGTQFSEMDLVVRDAGFQDRNHVATANNYAGNLSGVKADAGNFDFANWYYSNYVSAYLFMPTNAGIHPYLGAGLSYNYFTSQARTKPASYYFNTTGETLQVTPDFAQHYMSGFVEAGFFFGNRDTGPGEKGACTFLGLKYYFAGDIIHGDYKNTKDGIVQYTDHVVASGDYLAVSLRVGISVIGGRKRHWEPHPPKIKPRYRANRHNPKTGKPKKSKKSKDAGPPKQTPSPTTLGF